ncbi:MAG: hypothetical protein M3R13_01490 [Armatimonadota bacterium]|nr:hypothetical protein [Armatimonadota bacterium]
MDAGTYPNEEVAEYIGRYFVPVQINVQEDPGAMERFHTMWTPTIILKDDRGREHRRSQGYLNPQELLAELSLARLAAALDAGDYDEAVTISQDAIARTQFDKNRNAEARYWAGVANYKSTDDPSKLGESWKPLIDEMPDSEWARKASFIK